MQVYLNLSVLVLHGMISWLVAAGVLLVLAYATYLLFFNLDPEQDTRLEDFLYAKEVTEGIILLHVVLAKLKVY